jgi:hypothetical protein
MREESRKGKGRKRNTQKSGNEKGMKKTQRKRKWRKKEPSKYGKGEEKINYRSQ